MSDALLDRVTPQEADSAPRARCFQPGRAALRTGGTARVRVSGGFIFPQAVCTAFAIGVPGRDRCMVAAGAALSVAVSERASD